MATNDAIKRYKRECGDHSCMRLQYPIALAQHGLGSMIFSHSNYSTEQIETGIQDVLSGSELATIAVSIEQIPHTFTAYFAFEHDRDVRLYFMSDPSTLHGRAIGDCAHVALSIYIQPAVWGEGLQGIQAEGEARLLSDEQGEHALRAYGARFATFGASFRSLPELVAAGSPSRPYGITISRMLITNEQRFGRREIISASQQIAKGR